MKSCSRVNAMLKGMSRLLLAVVLMANMTSALADGTNILSVTSDPTDPVLHGQSFSVTSDDFPFTAQQVPAIFGGVSIQVGTPSNPQWTLEFAAADGQPIQVGTYDFAEDYPIQGPTFPGIKVIYQGETCQGTGRFVVLDIQVADDGTLQSFAADFDQYCDNFTAGLHGEIRYNSTVPLDAPTADAGRDQVITEGSTVTLSAELSVAGTPSDTITSYQWTQLSGPPVSLSDATVVNPTFTAPVVASGGEDLVFEVTITNDVSATSTAQTQVHVANPVDPYDALAVTVPQDFGNPGNVLLGPNDATFAALVPRSGPSNALAIQLYSFSNAWGLSFTAPHNKQFHTGLYDGAADGVPPSPTIPVMGIGGGSGQACDDFDTGHFYVRQITYDTAGNVTQFAADFAEYCDHIPLPMRGKIRFNSTVPIDDPAMDAGPDQVSYTGLPVTLDGTGTSSPSGSIVSYQWSQVVAPGDPVVHLSNPSAAKNTFTAPAVPAGGRTLTFQLVATDSKAQVNVDVVHIFIVADHDSKTAFYYQSQAGDPVGAGGSGLISSGNTEFLPGFHSANIQLLQINPHVFDDWVFSFSAGGAVPKAGVYALPASGAMQVSSAAGAACANPSRGLFVVRDVALNSSGTLDRLAADFVQECAGASGMLHGTLRYGSTSPLLVNTPVAYAGAAQVLSAPTTVTLDGSLSIPGWNSASRYLWAQVSGPLVAIVGKTQAMAQFKLPANLVTIAGTTLKFMLTVTNASGSSTSTTTVTAIEPSASSLTLQSDAGDPVGGGVNRSYTTPAANVALRSLAKNAVQVAVTNGLQDNWLLGLAAANGQRLSIGSFNGATRYTGAVQPTPNLYIDSVSRHATCKTVSGDFDVLDVQYDSTGTIESLAVDFDQTCNGAPGALHGKLRYHSAVP